ncbi:MAG TPA: hypothetical protein PLL10_10145, partial [Elusimicrobiales bacterium]|nr:hypothetical protein [Elusimicrobiales bacterium]
MANYKRFHLVFTLSCAAALVLATAAPLRAAKPSPGQQADALNFKTKPAQAQVDGLYLSAPHKQRAATAAKAMPFREIRHSPSSGTPRTLMRGSKAYTGSPVQAAQRFLEENKDYLKLDPSQLQLINSKTSLGITHLLYKQYYSGLPVDNAFVKVHMDSQGKVLYYSSTHLESFASVLAPSLPRSGAVSSIRAHNASAREGTGELVIFQSPVDGLPYLAWKASATDNSTGEPWIYYVDAKTGALLFRESLRRYAVSGLIQGHVYTDYPRTSGFTDCSTVTISNQYVWLQGYSTRTVTNSAGAFSFPLDGKLFASLKGPYISISHNMARSANYDTGSGT